MTKLSFNQIIKSYAPKNSEFYFIQIGANDGISGDPIHSFIKEFKWKGVLVEPQLEVFKKLVSTYKNVANLKLENSAIGNYDGYKDLFKISFCNDRWATGISSFHKFHLEKHIQNGYVTKMMRGKEHLLPQSKEDYITIEKVKVLTFQSLLCKYYINQIDLLQVDVEGYDYRLLKTINFAIFRPSIIQYEHLHMTTDQKHEIIQLLKHNGYSTFTEYINTVAFLSNLDDH